MLVEGDIEELVLTEVLPAMNIVNCHSCNRITSTLTALREIRAFDGVNCPNKTFGLTDRDRRSDEEVEHLAKSGISVIDAPGIEGPLLSLDVLLAVHDLCCADKENIVAVVESQLCDEIPYLLVKVSHANAFNALKCDIEFALKTQRNAKFPATNEKFDTAQLMERDRHVSVQPLIQPWSKLHTTVSNITTRLQDAFVSRLEQAIAGCEPETTFQDRYRQLLKEVNGHTIVPIFNRGKANETLFARIMGPVTCKQYRKNEVARVDVHSRYKEKGKSSKTAGYFFVIADFAKKYPNFRKMVCKLLFTSWLHPKSARVNTWHLEAPKSRKQATKNLLCSALTLKFAQKEVEIDPNSQKRHFGGSAISKDNQMSFVLSDSVLGAMLQELTAKFNALSSAKNTKDRVAFAQEGLRLVPWLLSCRSYNQPIFNRAMHTTSSLLQRVSLLKHKKARSGWLEALLVIRAHATVQGDERQSAMDLWLSDVTAIVKDQDFSWFLHVDQQDILTSAVRLFLLGWRRPTGQRSFVDDVFGQDDCSLYAATDSLQAVSPSPENQDAITAVSTIINVLNGVLKHWKRFESTLLQACDEYPCPPINQPETSLIQCMFVEILRDITPCIRLKKTVLEAMISWRHMPKTIGKDLSDLLVNKPTELLGRYAYAFSKLDTSLYDRASATIVFKVIVELYSTLTQPSVQLDMETHFLCVLSLNSVCSTALSTENPLQFEFEIGEDKHEIIVKCPAHSGESHTSSELKLNDIPCSRTQPHSQRITKAVSKFNEVLKKRRNWHNTNEHKDAPFADAASVFATEAQLQGALDARCRRDRMSLIRQQLKNYRNSHNQQLSVGSDLLDPKTLKPLWAKRGVSAAQQLTNLKKLINIVPKQSPGADRFAAGHSEHNVPMDTRQPAAFALVQPHAAAMGNRGKKKKNHSRSASNADRLVATNDATREKYCVSSDKAPDSSEKAQSSDTSEKAQSSDILVASEGGEDA